MHTNTLHIPDGAARKAALQPEIDRLAAYYSSKAWKVDFAADEAGLLPVGMKRGVLSEDGVYGVLERFEEIEDKGARRNSAEVKTDNSK